MSLDTFEQSLLTELRQHVAGRTSDRTTTRTIARRRWAVGLAGGGVVAAATAVVISLGVGVARPSAAYAVESQPDGDVVVTVYDLSDASGLEHALAAKGVSADVVYAPAFAQTDGRTPATDGADSAGCAITLAKVDGGLRFTLGASQIASDARLDIVTSGSSPADVGSPVAVTWSGGGC
jgi:hypothetical protein